MRTSLTILLLTSLALVACSAIPGRVQQAHQLAASEQFAVHYYTAASLPMVGFSRYTKKAKVLRVYIEGDGFAWENRSTPSTNPTPTEPLTFELAAKDPSGNLLYLGRPCQYIEDYSQHADCQNPRYWTSHRFAPVVIERMSQIIDNEKQKSGASSIELVGYSGGGAIAVLLASMRDDVASIVTVAGNLDHVALNRYHNVSPLRGSLNPIDVVQKVSHIPQRHFIGADDPLILERFALGYRNKMTDRRCTQIINVPNVTHEEGWVEQWSTLIQRYSPRCQVSDEL